MAPLSGACVRVGMHLHRVRVCGGFFELLPVMRLNGYPFILNIRLLVLFLSILAVFELHFHVCLLRLLSILTLGNY